MSGVRLVRGTVVVQVKSVCGYFIKSTCPPCVWSVVVVGEGGAYVSDAINILTPPSNISRLPHLLHQGEVLSFRDYHKWILRPILGLGKDRYVFPVYHPCWLVTTPGVLISGHIGVGVIFSGRKGGYL